LLTRSGLSQLTLRSTSSLFAIAVAIGLSATTLPTQSNPPQTQSSVPVLRANTRAVAVDVVVTRGHDEPVTALRKQDFHVIEDGKPQSIDFFEDHAAISAPPNIKLVPMPANVFTNVPAAPESDSVNVLLLDLLNTDRQDQSYVHQQITDYLKNMQPGVRVAIFTLSTGLRLIQGFTADNSLLRSSLDDKKNGVSTQKTSASRSLQDKQDDKEDIERLTAIQAGAVAIEEVERAQANLASYQENDRALMTLEALQNLARYLTGIPGRKNLIWFSGSFPISVFPSAKENRSFSQTREYNTAVKQTADMLTFSKIAVYPINAAGMMQDHSMGPEQDGNQAGVGPGLLHNIMDEAAQRANIISAMEQLAADTGGEAIFNNNDLAAATARAINNGAHYYTIVYTPTDKQMDGQYRRIEVKLTEGKYKLAYRRGYYADDMEKTSKPKVSKGLKSASASDGHPDGKTDSTPLRQLMARGMPSSTQILYGVRVLPAAPQPAPTAIRAGYNPKLPSPTTRYTADFLIDWKKVQLQPAPDGSHTGMIRLELLAYDRDGKALNWTGQTMGLTLDVRTYTAIQHSGIPAHLEIDLPNKDVYLVTGIYDLEADKAGTLEIPVDVRATFKTQAAVNPPASK
jgi:VWFA-related protein